MVEPRASMDPLDGNNYPTWKVQMRMVLMKLGVWRIVEGTEVPPGDDEIVALRKYNDRKDKALATIVLAVKTNLLYLIGDPQDPVEVWDKLSNQFQKKTWANKLALRRKLHGLRLRDQEPVQEHIKAMVEVFDELAVIGEAIDEEDRVVQILASLPDSYGMLVTALEANAEVPKLELVTERLLNEERKMKEKAAFSGNNNSNGNVFPGNCHSGENALLASNKFRNSPRTCYYCGKVGHIKAFCDELKKKNEEQQQEENRRTAIANFSKCAGKTEESSDEEYECIALVSEVMNECSEWIVDSAAGAHMCKYRKEFKSLKKLKCPKKVKVGNGQYVVAHSEGTVKLLVKVGCKVRKVKLHNVLFVPDLKYNLLSVSKAAALGKQIIFNKNGCHIVDNSTGEIIGTATKNGELYQVECVSRDEENQIKKGSVYMRGMEKALISVKKNNFSQEMMGRLNLIKTDKQKSCVRPNIVEGQGNYKSHTFKEENNDNLEVMTVYDDEVRINAMKPKEQEFQEDKKSKKNEFQEDKKSREVHFQEDMTNALKAKEQNVGEDTKTGLGVYKQNLRTEKSNSRATKTKMNTRSKINIGGGQSSKLQEDKKSSFLQHFQSCNGSALFSKENYVTNRQGYLMSQVFHDFPDSSKSTETSLSDLD